MNLDSEESGKVGLVLLVIFEGGEVNAIDVDLDTIATAFDKVVVPVVGGYGKAGEGGGVQKREGGWFFPSGEILVSAPRSAMRPRPCSS